MITNFFAVHDPISVFSLQQYVTKHIFLYKKLLRNHLLQLLPFFAYFDQHVIFCASSAATVKQIVVL